MEIMPEELKFAGHQVDPESSDINIPLDVAAKIMLFEVLSRSVTIKKDGTPQSVSIVDVV